MALKSTSRRVVFVHPDLGIGGAERLIIDAAVGLQSLDYKVTILTSYCNKSHCFEEARDGTLDVRVRGDAIFPPTIRGRLKILFSILRQLSLVASVGIFSTELRQLDPDVLIIDQLSAAIPFFRMVFPKAKILFYGHYPDRLLLRQEHGLLKRAKGLYRLPFDAIEAWSTQCSDSIVVNSKYTRSVFKQTFPVVRSRELKVIYPCVDVSTTTPQPSKDVTWTNKRMLLSINRFERKKNLDLAIKAFAGLSAAERDSAILVVAGGYDPRNEENAVCHAHLQELATRLELSHATLRPEESVKADLSSKNVHVLFLLSIPNALKNRLLQSSSLLIYTPENEHFGIVPLEAMLAEVPVLATNTGGPLETIYDGRTGFLRSPDKIQQWTDVMRKPLIPSSGDTLRAMGRKGRERVLAEFDRTQMAKNFDKEIQRLSQSSAQRPQIFSLWIIAALAVILATLFGSVTFKILHAVTSSPRESHIFECF